MNYDVATSVAGIDNVVSVIGQSMTKLELSAQQLHSDISQVNSFLPLLLSRERLLSSVDKVSALAEQINHWVDTLPLNIRFVKDGYSQLLETYQRLQGRYTEQAKELTLVKNERDAARQQVISTPPISFYEEMEESENLVVTRDFTFASGKINIEYAAGDSITPAEIAAISKQPECASYSQIEFDITGLEADWSWDKRGRGLYRVKKVILTDGESLEPYKAECDRIRAAHIGKDKISDCMYCEEHMASIYRRTRDFNNTQTDFEEIYSSDDSINH